MIKQKNILLNIKNRYKKDGKYIDIAPDRTIFFLWKTVRIFL